MQIGRVELFTDVPVITTSNVIDVLKTAYNEYIPTVAKMDYLLNYEAGVQPIIRTLPKMYRSDIDNKCVDNLANEIVEFNTGFIWGSPITLIKRDSEENAEENVLSGISELNMCFDSEGLKSKTAQLARFVEITGVGRTFIDIKTDYLDGDSYFDYMVLDPRNSFVVYSNDSKHQKRLGVVWSINSKGEKHFTCFTKDFRFEINNRWEHDTRSGEANPLGIIPITEWFKDYDRMGCFERQIDEMNNLNLLISDFTNDIEQNTQAVWHANDVEFPVEITKNEDGTTTERVRKPKTNEWMQTFTSPDGKTPFVKPLAIDYDYEGMLNNIITRRALILQKCNVPSRNDNSGGSTGIAMDGATGYTAAEMAASKQQNIMEVCKMEEVRIVLAAIRKSPDVPSDSPLLKLKITDIKPSIRRNKNYELATKVNFFATAVSHGIHGLHALKVMNAFEDVNEVWADSKELIEAYQKSIFEKSESENKAVGADGEEKPNSDRLMADTSDQVKNSPNLEG